MDFRRISLRSIAAILLFLLGLLLVIRLVLVQPEADIAPARHTPASVSATVRLFPSEHPTNRRIADATPTRRPLLPFATESLPRTIPPDMEQNERPASASSRPTDTAIPATAPPSSETPTPVPTLAPVASPTELPVMPTATATVTPTATVPTLTPTITSTPTRTPRPTWAVQPRIIGNEIDPPWWPCEEGQIKAVPKLKRYYPPDHASYTRTFVDVICFDTEQAAAADGYTRAP